MEQASPDIFARGTKVEICPFRRGHFYEHLARLDGKAGTVEGLAEEYKHELHVLVLLDGAMNSVSYPIKALRPIPED